ncbi:MAG: HAD hydrolase family protein [Gemmataceae bacterium]
MDIEERCRRIRFLLLDVDGVLTDGGITYADDGTEIKTFNVRDGLALKLWLQADKQAGILSGRTSEIVKRRAAELKLTALIQGADDKRPAFEALLREHNLEASEVCYVGDDLPDVPLIRRAGLGVSVADGCEEARQAAQYVTRQPGGRGAVRELVQLLLETQGLWQVMLERLGF